MVATDHTKPTVFDIAHGVWHHWLLGLISPGVNSRMTSERSDDQVHRKSSLIFDMRGSSLLDWSTGAVSIQPDLGCHWKRADKALLKSRTIFDAHNGCGRG